MFFLAVLLTIVAFLLLLVILGAFFFLIDTFLELPFVATKKDKVATIIKLSKIKSGATVVDLGSGDGRLLFAAAEKGAKAIGYEINPYLILLTKFRAKIKGLSGNVVVKNQSLWKADLAVADVIFVYGRQKTMKKFEDFVFKNAKEGTRITVNINPFPNKNALRTENGVFLHKV